MNHDSPIIIPSNKDLYEFLQAMFQHSLPESMRIYTIFYLAIRMTLISIVAIMIVILLKKRKFWLCRLVKVPRGRIICPNACEGLLFFAGIFYVCDSIYRVCSLHWYWDSSSYETNILLFTGVRLFPLWIAGFVHVVAIAFLGPLSPARLNPHLYHLLLFGAPLALMASTLPSLILGSNASNKSNIVYQSIRVELASRPGNGTPRFEDLFSLLEIGKLEKTSFYHFRNWAVTGAVFNAILMVMHVVASSALIAKIYSALRQQKQENPFASTEDSYVVVQHDQADRNHNHTLSVATTCVELDRVSLDEPTEASRRKVLLEFLIFTAVQTFCLLGIGATMLGGIIYMTSRLMSDQQYKHDLPLYRGKLIEVGYKYHMIEMGSVLVFGTPLMILVLYRHCFPVKVELKKKVKRQWREVPSIETQPSSTTSNGRFGIAIDTSQAISPLAKQSEWQSVSPLSPASPFEQKSERNQGQHTTRPIQKQSSQEIARDACAYTGSGVGRSIVLDALDYANQIPRIRRRNSPWDLIANASTFTDLETPAGQTSAHLYPTPHGVVEGLPLSPIAVPEDSFHKR